MNEKQLLEQALVDERRIGHRQQLLKRLWRLKQLEDTNLELWQSPGDQEAMGDTATKSGDQTEAPHDFAAHDRGPPSQNPRVRDK